MSYWFARKISKSISFDMAIYDAGKVDPNFHSMHEIRIHKMKKLPSLNKMELEEEQSLQLVMHRGPIIYLLRK